MRAWGGEADWGQYLTHNLYVLRKEETAKAHAAKEKVKEITETFELVNKQFTKAVYDEQQRERKILQARLDCDCAKADVLFER